MVDYKRDVGQAHYSISELEDEITEGLFGDDDFDERFDGLLNRIRPTGVTDDELEHKYDSPQPAAAPLASSSSSSSAAPRKKISAPSPQQQQQVKSTSSSSSAPRKKITAPQQHDPWQMLFGPGAGPRVSPPSPDSDSIRLSHPHPRPKQAPRAAISMKQPAAQDQSREEIERRQFTKWATESIPFDPARGRVNRSGEIITPSQRCVAQTKKGQHCKSKTCVGHLCHNHLKSLMGLKLAKSQIAGRGLFAARDIPAHAEISKYVGDWLTPEQQDRQEGNVTRYIFQAQDGGTNIDAGRRNTAVGRMINDPHGSNQRYNCDWVVTEYGDHPRVRIKSVRRIPKGAEILIRYGDEFWKKSAQLAQESAEAKAKGKLKARRAPKRGLALIPKEERRPKRGERAESSIAAVEAHTVYDEEIEPTSYKEAMQSKNRAHWQAAIDAEQQSIVDQSVYHKVDGVPRGSKLLSTRWVFKIKRDENGKIARFKARLVVRGFLQREGIDYNETFAPVAFYPHIRTILALAMQFGYQIHSADVITAFLHAPIEEKLFIASPEGFRGMLKGTTLELDKALYGLKQAPRAWNQRLVGVLQENDWRPCVFSDRCVFQKMSKSNKVMIMTIFVDDITYINHPQDEREMDDEMTQLERHFKITRLGESTHILGMRVTLAANRKSLILDQEAYLTRVLESIGFLNVKSADTPSSGVQTLVSEQKLERLDSILDKPRHSNSVSSSSSSSSTSKHHPQVTVDNYRSILGSLSYAATSTRPDIAHAVNLLARRSASPGPEDVHRLIRLCRYVSGTRSLGLKYQKNSNLKLLAFSDSDWAGDAADSKSTTGILIKLGQFGGALMWSSKKQSTVALSSTEAEYTAACECGREVQHFRRFLANLGIPQQFPTTLFIDNQTTIRMIVDEGNEARRKHIRVKYHYIKQLYEEGAIFPQWVKTQDQQADILTKSLTRQPFEKIRSLVMGSQ